MRFESLALDCYGPFLHQELIFDPSPRRINLLLAANGAGKSVLRAAFADLLFDLPHQSPMTFLHPASRLRLTARLRLADGTSRLLARRKGQGNTLSDGAAPVPPEDLRLLLGGADAGLFRTLFALDTEALRRGGRELSRSSGRLGHMLLAGSGGLGQVQLLLEALVRDRDAIGRADLRQIAKPLWRAAEEAREAGRQLAQAALRPDAWLGMEKRTAAAERQLAALRDERLELEAELARLTALRAVRPWLRHRDEALSVLAAADDVPRLEPGFEARWARAVAEHVRAAAAAAESGRRLADAKAALGSQPIDPTLLDAADRIEAVLREAVTALNAANHLPEVEQTWRQAALEAARLRRELGWDVSVAVPAAALLRKARELLATRTGRLADADSAARELAKARRRMERAGEELASLPPAEDTAALEALLRDIRAAGDPASRLEAARRGQRDGEAALAAALAALPGRALTGEQLRQTRAPAEPALAACEAALTEAEAVWRDAQRASDGLARERTAVEASLAKLRREAALPEPGALAAARAERDRLWDAAVNAGGAGVALAFERALRHADAVADTLIAHAAQVADTEAQRRRLADIAGREAAADAAGVAAAEGVRRAQDGLASLATAAGAADGVMPAALRGFLAARTTALDGAIRLDRARAEAADLEAALDQAARRLADAGVAGDGLASMLIAAEARVAASREAGTARKAALAEAKNAAGDLQERTLAEARTGEALAAWNAAWLEAVAALRRPADESPEASGATLELIDQLRAQKAEAAGSEIRVRDMRAAVTNFAAGITALCAQVAPDLAALPPQQAAAQLQRRLREQRDALARQEAQLRNRAAAQQAAAAAVEKARAAAAELAALRAALGVADDEAAAAQLKRVRPVTEAQAKLAEARQHILSQGGGRTEAELDAMAAAGDAAAERARIDTLAARQAELGPLVEAASAEARSAADDRDRAGTGDDAPAAAARREAALAALARHAGEALVQHAAASLLRAGLEAGRDEAGLRSVGRIGAAFRRLTCGAHAGVAVQDDGTDRVLVALEADGTSCKQVDELSEGTSDQLFLALRLVALEDYVAANPPLPFIADDVLQTFDDARALAALRALLDLSARVQVIVLTHHPHVLALAERLPAGTVHSMVLPDPANG
jgi:uncharacterized protein YhaN